MASRAEQKASTDAKAERQAALRTLAGDELPLPTEARSDPIPYSDDLPDEAVQLGCQGLSEAQIAAHWAIDLETLNEWREGHQPLKAALSRARTAALAWWEERARRAIVTGDNRFPAGAWAQVVKARFSDYADKPGVSITVDLGRLVIIDKREPGLPDRQMVGSANLLIEHGPARLAEGLTASHSLPATPLAGGEPRQAAEGVEAEPAEAPGVGAKPPGPGALGGSRSRFVHPSPDPDADR